LSILLTLLLAVPAAHATARLIPIVGPTTITHSGNYIVAKDLTVAISPTPLITVLAPRVEIDLNGYTITNDDTLIRATGGTRLVLHSGALVGKSDTAPVIDVDGTTLVIIEDLEISGGLSGIELRNVDNFEIRRNLLTDIGGDCGPFGCNNAHGIFVDAAHSTGTIEHNTVRDTQSDGIRIDGSTRGTLIVDNAVIGVASSAIRVADGFLVRIERNRLSTGTTGIDFEGDHATIEGNNVAGGFTDAISVEGDNSLIFDNVAIGALDYGIVLRGDSDHNHIDRNLVIGNYAAGIAFLGDADENTYGRNTVRDNGAYSDCTAGTSACDNAEVCDLGTGNHSFGDNIAAGPGGC
jgi:parallel beta-helix repeat protein